MEQQEMENFIGDSQDDCFLIVPTKSKFW